MSEQAIMGVTQGIRALLLSQLSTTAKVTLLPPGEELPDGSGVNLYLYRVAESPYLKNIPYPGDRAGAPPQAQPALSLELFYLLTPFGPVPTDGTDEAQRVLGEAMLALYRNPILNRVHVPGFDADAKLPPYLLDSYEDIRIRDHPITLDELSTIWSTLGNPYRLTVAYEVTLVQLVEPEPAVPAGGVVQTIGLDVATIAQPSLTQLVPASGALAQSEENGTLPTRLTLVGFGFAGRDQSPVVQFGGVPLTPVGEPTAQSITVELPPELPAGPDVDVFVRLGGLVSGALTFRVEPWVATVTPLRSPLDAVPALTLAGSGLAGAHGVQLTGPGVSTLLQPPSKDSDASTLTVPAPTGATSNTAPAGALVNGTYSLTALLVDGSLSNARRLEVVPLLGSGSFSTDCVTLILVGARLDGSDVRLFFDGEEYALGPQADATQLTYVFGRPAVAGAHRVAVQVDGFRSHTIEVQA